MPTARVIAINDHEVRRFRDRIADSIANLERLLTEEVAAINERVRKAEREIEQLKLGGEPPSLSA